MEKYKVLSLDLWDTVIRRKCHPDEIKISTARYIFLKYNNFIKDEFKNVLLLAKKRVECERKIAKSKSSDFDDEYIITDVFALLIEETFNDLSEKENIVFDLYNYELNTEKEFAYLDPTISQKIKTINYEKLAYISDFYAKKTFLDSILESIGIDFKFDYKFVSCDYSLNKRSGRLYDKAESEIGIKPAEHIHIGDNKHSDVDIPIKKGITAIHYLPEEEHNNRKQKEAGFSFNKLRNYKDFENIIERYKSSLSSEKSPYKTGVEISSFFVTFVLWVIENSIKNGIQKIYYFTREGEFFKQIHDSIKKNNPYLMNIPEAEILEVSRISTFAPSLREVSLDEMMRIWNQYSVQSMAAFFKSVNIKQDDVKIYLDKYGIDFEQVIQYPWLDERVKDLFADTDFVKFFQNSIQNQKNQFLLYSKSKAMTTDEKAKIAIVDIGWRGTIQDNICYLFPNYDIYGYYLGLIPFLNEQPKNSFKFGFLNESPDCELMLRNVTPLEMLSNSPNGSTIGYENGIAKRKKEKYEDDIFYEYTKYAQDGILDMVKVYCDILKIHALTSDAFKEDAFNKLKLLVRYPRKDLAEVYFTLKHNEEFGVGAFVDKHTEFRPLLFFKALLFRKKRRELIDFLNGTSWPQGYLVKYNLNYANKIYNNLIDKRNH